jgi:hypothetical protein
MKTVLSLFLGIVLVVVGTAVLTYQGITVTTAERQLINVGPLQAATQQSNWTITLPPILGAILLTGGTALVFLTGTIRRMPKQDKSAPKVPQKAASIGSQL